MLRKRALVKILIGLVVVALAVAVACDGDDEEPSPSATACPTGAMCPSAAPCPTGTPCATGTGGAGSPTEAPFSGGSLEPEEGAGSAVGTTAVLLDVRTGKHVDFDRITFEFRDARPGYFVEYVEPPIVADPSGNDVQIDGGAFLRGRMEPAAGHDPDTGGTTYPGPLELKPGYPALVEAERTGDFEGVVTWVLGLSETTDFRVFALNEPFRIVVDVKHP